MSIGVIGISTNAKREQSGAPFPAGSADNGLSVSPAGTIVLGNDVGEVGSPAALISDREIPMEGFLISMPSTVPTDLFRFPSINGGVPGADFFINHNSVAFPGGNDEVVNFGFNITPSLTPVVAGEPCLAISMEGSYQPMVGQYLQEFHVIYVNPAGTQVRPFSLTINTNSVVIDGYMSVSSFELKDSDGSGQNWFQLIGGNDGLTANLLLFSGAGAANQFQILFDTSAATTVNAEVTGPGNHELYFRNTWNFVYLPTMFSSSTYNEFQAQTLPAGDGLVILGSVTQRWARVNAVVVRGNLVLAGDFSADQIPSAYIQVNVLSTGAANTAPLKLPVGGTLLTVPENGAIETNTLGLFYTSGGTRRTVFTGNDAAAAPATTAGVTIANFYGTSATNFLGTPDSWTAVTINGTAYKIPLYL